MTTRFAVIETVIAAGTTVRLSKEAAGNSVKERMARWLVLSKDQHDARVSDVEDPEDFRTFALEDLEIVKDGKQEIVGYAEVRSAAVNAYPKTGAYEIRSEAEYPSLFDDPEAEDEDDEDFESDDEDLLDEEDELEDE